MVPYYGDFAEDDTVLIPFNTFSSDDPSASVTITNLADADLKVHKDGAVAEIVTDGATVVIDFDGITGNHLVTIDTSVHADYSTGSEYAVRMEGTTVDGATINAWIGAFSIERAGGALALAKEIKAAVITNAAGADIAADIIAVKTETASILADTDVLGKQVVLTGQASAGSSTSITLTGGVATAADYDGATCIITGGTGIGQARTILSYAADTVATVTRDWAVAPAADSTFIIIGRDYPAILEAGTAVAGGAATITLDANAPTTVDIFKNNHIMITAGTGAGQTRLIGAYSALRVCTVLPNWVTNPDNTSVYQVLPAARVDIQGWAGNVVTGDGDWAALPDAAAINAEVLDVLSVDTFAQPGDEAPAATQTLAVMLSYLYKQWRNKTWRNKTETTATKIHLYDDAGTNKDHTSTISDDATTFTKGEFGVGDA
jgi:fructose-specific component phosphotransferase system IIB-like protein